MHEHLENRAPEAEGHRIQEPLFGNLGVHLERLIPAPEHEERVADLREDAPLAGSGSTTTRDGQGVVEVRQRLLVPVEPECEVREVEQRVVLHVVKAALARDRQALLEECHRLLRPRSVLDERHRYERACE